MKKTLINSDQDLLNIFTQDDCDMNADEIESILNIEFAFEDGSFRDDWVNGVEINEDQEIDLSVFRKYEDSVFPEKYPCLVVYNIENNFDRFGKVKFRMFDFVYQSDFLQ
jgi:hypothetical protein